MVAKLDWRINPKFGFIYPRDEGEDEAAGGCCGPWWGKAAGDRDIYVFTAGSTL